MKTIPLYLLLLFILLAGAGFRLWRLDTNPPAMFRDEAEKGYTAWSLARTGGYLSFSGLPDRTELTFRKWPVFINVFGVYTSAVYQYCALPFTAVGGLNEWTTRLPAALAGILTVLVVFLLVKGWTGKVLPAFFSAFFLAVSPWHIVFSRWALQGIFLPLFIIIALLFFYRGLKRKSWQLLLSGLFFGLAFYTYEIGRLFVPLFLVCLFLIYRKSLLEKRKWSMSAALLFLVISVPVFLYYVTGDRAARLYRLSIFSRDLKFQESLILLITNYLKHFNPSFLFLFGDSELRHSLLGMGMMYLFEAPLLLYGLWLLVQKRTPLHRILLCWFFLFPVASSMTREGIPHALRSIVALPMLQIICGIAAASLFQTMSNACRKEKGTRAFVFTILMILILCMMGLNIYRMGRNLFSEYPSDSAFNWQYGIKQALHYIHKEEIPPDKVHISGYITYAPYLVMFYDRLDPKMLKDKGIAGLGYNFLPPGIPAIQVWERLSEGSCLILYAGELQGVKPAYRIYYPQASHHHDEPPQPVLEVYIKKR